MKKHKNGLADLRNSREWTQEEAAKHAGMSVGGYRKLEYGERRLKDHQIRLFKEIYGVSEREVLNPEGDADQVPLVGYVGAGAEAHYYAEGQGPFEMVPAPDGASETTVAVEIRGDSLGPLFDRWLVYYDEIRSPVTSDQIGRLCVVGLHDGRVLVKKVTKSRSGLYHLLSNNEVPILDTDIAWAARVKHMVPR